MPTPSEQLGALRQELNLMWNELHVLDVSGRSESVRLVKEGLLLQWLALLRGLAELHFTMAAEDRGQENRPP